MFPDNDSFWMEESEDNPTSLKQALDTNRQKHRLLMKAKGYNNIICQICSKLDESIELIYNDLNLYVSSTINDGIQFHDSSDIQKKQTNLVEFLRDCSQNGLSE